MQLWCNYTLAHTYQYHTRIVNWSVPSMNESWSHISIIIVVVDFAKTSKPRAELAVNAVHARSGNRYFIEWWWRSYPQRTAFPPHFARWVTKLSAVAKAKATRQDASVLWCVCTNHQHCAALLQLRRFGAHDLIAVSAFKECTKYVFLCIFEHTSEALTTLFTRLDAVDKMPSCDTFCVVFLSYLFFCDEPFARSLRAWPCKASAAEWVFASHKKLYNTTMAWY